MDSSLQFPHVNFGPDTQAMKQASLKNTQAVQRSPGLLAGRGAPYTHTRARGGFRSTLRPPSLLSCHALHTRTSPQHDTAKPVQPALLRSQENKSAAEGDKAPPSGNNNDVSSKPKEGGGPSPGGGGGGGGPPGRPSPGKILAGHGKSEERWITFSLMCEH